MRHIKVSYHYLSISINFVKVFSQWKEIASVMRHRVFEDDEDYEIDKYDIQVCVFAYENDYGLIIF